MGDGLQYTGQTEDCLASNLMDGESIPIAVHDAYSILKTLGVWFQFSRNDAAYGCADAAEKRNRSGEVGIPICDELKTLLCRVPDRTVGTKFVRVHARADRRIDFRLVRILIGTNAKPQLATKQDLEKFGLQYGTINPFRAAIETGSADPYLDARSMDIFDLGLLSKVSSSSTMMTNAGALTWAVEFDPVELVAAIANSRDGVLVGDVSIPGIPNSAPS